MRAAVHDPAVESEERRAARRRSYELVGRGEDPAWFEQLYAEAGRDPQRIPWADLEPHPMLVEWCAREITAADAGLSALVVGCGLGDDAEHLASLGLAVTAFDISPEAVRWCAARSPGSAVRYEVADLFHLPAAWQGAFGLVAEVYTVQALAPTLHLRALRAAQGAVAPGGRMVVIGRAASADDHPTPPPWPLTGELIESVARGGFVLEACERLVDAGGLPRVRATYRRAS